LKILKIWHTTFPICDNNTILRSLSSELSEEPLSFYFSLTNLLAFLEDEIIQTKVLEIIRTFEWLHSIADKEFMSFYLSLIQRTGNS